MYEQLVNDPTMNRLGLKGVSISNGRLEAESIDIDSNNVDAEMEALDRVLAHVSQTRENNSPGDGMLLSALIETYFADRTAVEAWALSTEAENKVAYEQMLGLLGDRPAALVTRQDARRLLQTLQRMKSIKGTKYSVSVINRRMGLMSSLYRWAKRENIVEYNPFEGLRLKPPTRADKQKDKYTTAEISRLFDPARFVADPRRPSRYWLPLLSAYSGCRIGEAAQLTVASVRSLDGVWILEFDDEMRLKTSNAARIVPVHSELFRLGLLEYVQYRKERIKKAKSGDHRLFPELKIDSARAGGAVSNWWNNTHSKQSQVTRSEVSFHSLRHGVQTMFRSAGVPETIAAEIVGHERGGMSYGRYAKPGQLQPLVDAIGTIDYGVVLEKVPSWKK